MNTKNALLVLAGLMLAWACAAFADMTMTWAGERQGVAKAAVAGDTESAEATDVVAAEEDEEEESSITREEYLATVAYVEGEAAVDELSRRMVEDMFGPSDDGVGSQYGDSTLPGGGDDGVSADPRDGGPRHPDSEHPRRRRGAEALPRMWKGHSRLLHGGTVPFAGAGGRRRP